MSAFRSFNSAPTFNARLATAAAISSLSTLLTVDGVATAAGDRVLVKDHTTAANNGLYVAQAGTWVRAPEFGGAGLLYQDVPAGHVVTVAEGNANADTQWECTTNGIITPGTTALAYKRFDGAWDEWETLYVGTALLAASAAGSGVNAWLLRYDGGTPILSTSAQNAGTAMFYLDPAQYAVTGKTIQVRLAASVVTNSTAPGITFTFGLYPVSSVAAFVPTLGAASTTVAIATPALNTRTPGWGAAISMPAAGEYVLGCATSGANAAATQILNCALQVRAI